MQASLLGLVCCCCLAHAITPLVPAHTVRASGSGDGHISSFALLGPFTISKGEIDADPLEATHNGAQAAWNLLFNGNKSPLQRSELLSGGLHPTLKTLRTQGGAATIEYNEVDWQGLVNSVGGMELLEYQSAVLAVLRIDSEPTTVAITCTGVALFYVDSNNAKGELQTRGPFAGNAYFGAERIRNTMLLGEGFHVLRMRLRVKHRGRVMCKAVAVPVPRMAFSVKFQPDWVLGEGAVGKPSLRVGIELSNPTVDWVEVTAVSPSGESFELVEDAVWQIAPSQSTILPVALVFNQASIDSCLPPFVLQLDVHRGAELIASEKLKIKLRCRKRGQSILSTFIDCDGSLQLIAVVHPPVNLECPVAGCPVLLNLHGTSISASDSADSFKVKLSGDKDFRFGWHHGWLLAPSRHGAHNWEGIGRRHALAAVRWLRNASRSSTHAADVERLVVAGHSMGAHGALLFSVLEPGRVRCLNANAGWIRKEQYGDSNVLFLHDHRLDLVDTRLKYLLEASVVENMVDRSVQNIARSDVPILLRVGAADRAVHPFYSRRITRILEAYGANVTYAEIADKEHWWWDTIKENDGGAVNDRQLRGFFRGCARSLPTPATKFSLVTDNPASTGELNGVRILQQQTPYQHSEIRAEKRAGTWKLETKNVQRFAVSSKLPITGATVLHIDGREVQPGSQVPSGTRNYCWHSGASHWSECADKNGTASLRGPTNYGPMRLVFESRFVIVYGEKLLDSALFIANLIHDTGDGFAKVLSDQSSWDHILATGHNIVFVGGPLWNRWAKALLPQNGAVQATHRGVKLGPCWFSGSRLGVAALQPLVRGNGDQLGLLLDGSDLDGIKDMVWLGTPTIPPMVRQPFTNTLPDFVVSSRELRARGSGALLAAGFWGNEWEYRADVSFIAYCRPNTDTTTTIGIQKKTVNDEL